ncbi:FAD-binding domain-containing protein [Gymnodinialimonas hymeniacidonis]|uniref:FAD-binding domain-containing protein n=1 Tax=Gymnodinialimonas hymeniacidonis TaxID=3126508 RepID=UPI0034C644AC
MSELFPPKRLEALSRLSAFVPKSGRDYAAGRNYDLPDQGHPHVSQLSPYLRHRLLTEEEVCEAVLGRYSLSTAEKFIQEVCWRTYWKGWLEMRPSVWADYANFVSGLEHDPKIISAEAGETEIEAFNAWALELVETGYLHNHARMWFASIWIFTLGLPWQAGADFFMRHLLDGDPASNTLSWRWVAGLQTPGKHYIARSSNISKYTEGRHNPEWRLNTQAEPLSGPPHPERRPLRPSGEVQAGLRTGLLLHEDDLAPGFLLDAVTDPTVGAAALLSPDRRSPGPVSEKVSHFVTQATEDAMTRWQDRLGPRGPVTASAEQIVDWARAEGLEQVVAPYAPVGPAASSLRSLRKQLDGAGITLVEICRDWDIAAWPHATHGFFRFKKAIPDLVSNLARKAA